LSEEQATTPRSSQDNQPSVLRCELQNEVFGRAVAVLETGVRDHAFPGAVAAVTQGDALVCLKTVGRFTYQPDSPLIVTDAVWDLASVTKVVATTAAAMILYERGLLDIDMPLAQIVPEFVSRDADPRRREVTLSMLLAHSSGLPSYYRMYEQARSRDELLAACFAMPLEADPGARMEYSDIGFILLGVALERLADGPLDSFCQREVFAPLGLRQTTFNPPQAWHASIPPTEDDQRFRNRVIQGEVNDENAFVMGGVAGHAGVFSTGADVARFGHAMLRGGMPIVRGETVRLFTERQRSPVGTSRALGWDTPSAPSQSGQYYSARSFGHLGFTGTSLWCDPEGQISITLLTNRTWPDRSSQLIKQLRPRFHDALMQCLRTGNFGD
jgi:CubicO group peptidase (beta-lactamase class C family)